MKEFIQNLKISYHSGFEDNLGKDFYSPCLSKCNEYKRTTGDFTSNVIFDWGEALINIIEKDEGKCVVKIIANPNLPEEDKLALSTFVDNQNRDDFYDKVTHNIFQDALDIVEKNLNRDKSKEIKLKIFCYLVATRKLILKFGFPKHVRNANVFHTKDGIFYFDNDLKVGFSGSSNETHGGHLLNIENIHIYKNLDGIDPHIEDIEEKFELSWKGNAPGFDTRKLNKKTLDLITSYAPNRSQVKEYIKKFKEEFTKSPVEIPENQVQNNIANEHVEIKENYLDILDKKWEFQQEAREKFIAAKWGILEMATGSGKTRTALSIITQLIKEKKINKIIIQLEKNNLIDQWEENIKEWLRSETYEEVNLLKYTAKKNQIEDFIGGFTNEGVDLLLVSKYNLSNLLDRIIKFDLNKTIIIHDEVHGLFSDKFKVEIEGKQKNIGYRLGLSATVKNDFEPERTQLLFNEIGKVVYEYKLDQAIKDGVLVEFDLIPLNYNLLESDKKERNTAYAKFDSDIKNGVNPIAAKKFLYLTLADIKKNCVDKVRVFKNNFNQLSQYLHRSFIFADEKVYVQRVLNILIHKDLNFKTHTGDDGYENINKFSNGEVDCLLNCEKLSEGIDVKSVNTIVLFATPQGIQLIQRLGRVLRSDTKYPNKRACVIDFFLESDMEKKEGSDYNRYVKLKNYSEIKKNIK